jgi:hypothetical protein
MKEPRRPSIVKGDPESIAMRAGAAAAPRQPGKGKANVGGNIRAHAQKFTHRVHTSDCRERKQPNSE